MSTGESHIASTQRAIAINLQVIEFLRSGGEIQQIPTGVSGEQLRLTKSESGLKVYADKKHQLREINARRVCKNDRKAK